MLDWEKEPSEELLLELLLNNPLGRNDALCRFMHMLDNIPEGKTIAINGKWGSGKTFFVKQLVMLINAQNTLRSEESTNFKLKKLLENIKYCKDCIAIRYDAWENDSDDDPILSLVYDITQDLNIAFSYTPDKMMNIANIGAALLDILPGMNAQNILNSLRDYKVDNPLNYINSKKVLEQKINEYFDSICVNGERKVYIFIDELDRCSPSFAVKLLERIKHYFINKKVTFIFSVNIEQLQHTVKKYYGESFDAYSYLHRFFYLNIGLPQIDYRKYYLYNKFEENDIFAEISKGVVEYYDFSLRDVGKYFTMCSTLGAQIRDNRDSLWYIENHNTLLFFSCVIVPILTGIYIKDISLYEQIISGKYKEEFINCMIRFSTFYSENLILMDNESFYDEDNKVRVSKEDKYEQIYDALFVNNERFEGVTVGKLSFSRKGLTNIKSFMSILSKNSKFD